MMSDLSLVHVPSKDYVLLIGATRRSSMDISAAGMWRYRIQSSKWEEILDENDQPFELDTCERTPILSSNEQFVVLAPEGGYEPKQFQVLEIRDDDRYTLWNSSVTMLDHMHCWIMMKSGGRSETQLLAFGWIRQWIRKQVFAVSMSIPAAIMSLIGEWCSLQKIHCVTLEDYDKKNAELRAERGLDHKMIPLTDILASKLVKYQRQKYLPGSNILLADAYCVNADGDENAIITETVQSKESLDYLHSFWERRREIYIVAYDSWQ